MSITYTNAAKIILDKMITIIGTEFPRFSKRIKTSIQIESKDLGREDSLYLRPVQDINELENSAGRTSQYQFDILYIKQIHPKVNWDNLTDIAEHLKKLFGVDNNRSLSTFWHYCNVNEIDYQPEELVEMENYYGFKMNIEIHKAIY